MAQGGEYIVQGFAAGTVHLHIAAGNKGSRQFARQPVQCQVAPNFIVTQQVGNPQPHPALAQAGQLQTPGPVIFVIFLWQPYQQAALEMEDHIPQTGLVFTLGAAPPGHADQPGQLTVGRA